MTKRSKNKASEFYVQKLEELIKNTSKAADILSPNSATKFQGIQSQPPLYRIEKTEKGDVLWIPKRY